MATSKISSNTWTFVRNGTVPSTQSSNFEVDASDGPKLYVNEKERKARVRGWLNVKQALAAEQGLGCIAGLGTAYYPSATFLGNAILRANSKIVASYSIGIGTAGVITLYTFSGVATGSLLIDIEWFF